MKRRDFIKTSAIAGAGVLAGTGCSSMKKTAPYTGPGFDLHPFVKAHPEAVFINLTSIGKKTDRRDIHNAGYYLAGELFVKTDSGGYPNSTKITCKPNWTCNPLVEGKSAPEHLGINTDKNFVEGFCKAVREKGPQQIYIHECACPGDWAAHGWPQMAQANNFILRDLTSRNFWDYKIGEDLHFVKVPNGVVFKEIAFQTPVNMPDTFLIDIAKFKAHGMGITASIKNLQGLSGKRFHEFCGGFNSIFNNYYDKRYFPYFHKDYVKHVQSLTKKHIAAGIPRWDKSGEKNYGGGFYMEQWVQRMLDSLSVTKTGLCMVEGIYGRDGDGFAGGPHDGKAQDYMANNVIFGLDPFRVDIITHWLAGHEPGNFGLFHIGIERGMSNVLDPNDIPVYLWDEGKATLRKLDTFQRTDLVTYYMQRNYNGQNEPRFHLCNEPFDYSAWKAGKKTASRPSINDLGKDSHGKRIMEVSLPQKEDVYVDVLNKNGDVVWRLIADGLEPGTHQVTWDGFGKPGIYTVYVKGMGWDVVKQVATYS